MAIPNLVNNVCPTPTLSGAINITSSKDIKGYKTNKIKWKVYTTGHYDAEMIWATEGLPHPGDNWASIGDKAGCNITDALIDSGGVYGDIYCLREQSITPLGFEKDAQVFTWAVEQEFTNDPDKLNSSGQDDCPVPFCEPIEISYGADTIQKRIPLDAFGQPLCTTAREFKEVEVDYSFIRWSVKFYALQGTMDLLTLSQAINCVNFEPCMGFGAGVLRFSNFSINRKYRDMNSSFPPSYYNEITYDFEVRMGILVPVTDNYSCYDGWCEYIENLGTMCWVRTTDNFFPENTQGIPIGQIKGVTQENRQLTNRVTVEQATNGRVTTAWLNPKGYINLDFINSLEQAESGYTPVGDGTYNQPNISAFFKRVYPYRFFNYANLGLPPVVYGSNLTVT